MPLPTRAFFGVIPASPAWRWAGRVGALRALQPFILVRTLPATLSYGKRTCRTLAALPSTFSLPHSAHTVRIYNSLPPPPARALPAAAPFLPQTGRNCADVPLFASFNILNALHTAPHLISPSGIAFAACCACRHAVGAATCRDASFPHLPVPVDLPPHTYVLLPLQIPRALLPHACAARTGAR